MKPALLLLAAFCAAAETATVEGRVINLTTGDPVRRAAVNLRRPGETYTVETTSAGLFRADVPAGAYTISVERAGFLPGVGKPIEIGEGARISGIVVALTPTAVITGRVLDSDGDPVSGVAVTAMQYRYEGGKRRLRPVKTVASDDRGQYRLFDLSPGRYYIQASRKGGPSAGLLLGFHPSAADTSGAAVVTAGPGIEVKSIDVTLRPLGTHSVRVRIANAPPVRFPPEPLTPILMASLTRRGAETPAADRPNFRRRGDVFEASDVSPGAYELTVRQIDRQKGPQLFVRRWIEVVDTDVEIAVELLPPLSVSGRVRGLPAGLQTTVRLEIGDEAGQFWTVNAQSDAAGSFELEGVPPDSYYVRVSPPEGYYLESVRLGDRAVPSQKIDVAAGAPPVTLCFAPDGAEIAGLVLDSDDRPVPHANVVLEPLTPDWPDRLAVLRADPNGNFRIHDVAPGNYRLFAWIGQEADDSTAITLRAEPDGEHRLTVRVR